MTDAPVKTSGPIIVITKIRTNVKLDSFNRNFFRIFDFSPCTKRWVQRSLQTICLWDQK